MSKNNWWDKFEEQPDFIKHIAYVSSKFESDWDWQTVEQPKGLKHIRYETDFKGFDVWWRRWRRFLRALFGRRTSMDKFLGLSLWDCKRFAHVYLQKEKNLPDASVKGNLFHWLEDAEYAVAFQPNVGRAVLDFIVEEPDNPHAKIIRDLLEKAVKDVND